jgi:flagellar hook-basal body complex protein FliE
MSSPIQPTGSLLRSVEGVEHRLRFDSKDDSFADLLKRAVNDASDLQSDARTMIEAFLRGEPVDLHQVMGAVEEAGISLQLLVEIRNKLTDAYRTVMNLS